MTGQVSLTEIIAIAAVAQCKEDALTVAVREHARFVFKVAYSVLRNRDDAEDAAQEAFLRAMKHHREFSKVEDQRAWLARTVWRIAIDRIRRRPQLSLNDEANQALLAELRAAETSQAEFRANVAGAESLAITDQMLRLVQSMITALPSDLRHVLTLSTVEEMTSREIASVLGISDATVRTRLLRARQLLKDKLAALLEKRTPGELRCAPITGSETPSRAP